MSDSKPTEMDMICALANARYALEFWEREAGVMAKGANWTEWPVTRGRQEADNLRRIEKVLRERHLIKPARPLSPPDPLTTQEKPSEGISNIKIRPMGIERAETKRKGTWSAEKIIADWSAAFIAANGKSPAQPLSMSADGSCFGTRWAT